MRALLLSGAMIAGLALLGYLFLACWVETNIWPIGLGLVWQQAARRFFAAR